MRKRQKFMQHGGQARVLAAVTWFVIRPLIWLIMTLGSMLYLPIAQMANAQAAGAVLNEGYSPTSMNVSNLPQAQVVHHDKAFVKNLKANTCALRVCARRELPEMSGNQHRLYMYNTLGANTTQQAEGTVGAGLVVTVVNNTSTIGQLADYVNMSDMAMKTAIDPALENIQKELAYRLGLSISTMVIRTLDGASTVDGSVDDFSKANGTSLFGKSDITAAVAAMTGRNIQAFDKGHMTGMVHAFAVGDMLNDTSNNSATDILKRTAEGIEKLSELPAPDGDEVPVLEWGGVRFHQTSLVTQTANYQASGKTALRAYVVGEDGVIAISLGKKEGSMIGDGDWRNLKLWMYKATEPSQSDPSRVIGGWTSYNAKFTVALPPDLVQRVRVIDAVSNIS